MVRTPLRMHGVVCCVLLLLCGAGGYAQVPRAAALNPEFSRGGSRAVLPGQRAFGYQPAPVDWSHLTGQRIFRGGRTTFPASYDLRTQGRVSAVKNQGSSGSCWAFGILASLESSLLPSETSDYSENNLKNSHGFDLHPNTGGGNREMATAYLARWSGPVNETDDPFVASSTSSSSGLTVRKHIQQVTYIPDRANATDNANIKQALMSYGAVATTMFWDNAYYRASSAAFYNPSNPSSNHLVTIVGWDDAYAASQFPTTPPGNGAFLVKNSWGTSFGSSGYFYISYYDKSVGKGNALLYNTEAPTNYTRSYQYDTLGQTSSVGYGGGTAWMANIFTAAANEQIKAVGVYALAPNTAYQLTGYLAPTNGPLSTTAAFTQSGTISEPGYHTVSLTTPLAVNAGQKFSLVMKYTASYAYPIPIERPFAGYSSTATAQAGQSYISVDGVSWSDLTTYYPNSNVCLKAFAGFAGGVSTLTAVNLTASAASPQPVETALTLTATKTGGSAVEYKYEVLNGAWITLREYSTSNTMSWSPTAAGIYTLRVSVRDLDYPATVVQKTLVFTITPPLTAVSLATSLAAPQPMGKAIKLTATKTGGANVQYQFSTSSNDGSTWSVAQAYGAAVDYTWTPATAGAWQVKVTAREGASGTPVDSAGTPFLITPAPPTAVALAAAQASPQPASTAIALSATKTGGSTVEYKFEVVAGSGTATVLHDYATTATTTWTPAAAGTYTLRVSAREATLPATVVIGTLSYTVLPPLSAVSLAMSPASPQPVGKAIMLTAVKTGGAQVQYQFSASSNGGSTWSVLQAYSTTATKSWIPTTAGTWQLKVAAREGSSGTPVESAAASYTIAPTPPTAVTLAAAPAVQVINAAVTLTATKTGGSTVEYKYEATLNGTTTVIRDFATTATASWTPTAAGAYTLTVSARESTLPATVVKKTLAFTVNPALSAVTLATGLASPQSVNKTIKLTATKTGGATVQYQFSASSNGGSTWNTLQAYSTVTTKDWIPATTGSYQLKVAAREGSSGTPVETAAMAYTISPAPPTAVTLAASPAAMQVVNTAVALTATKTGGSTVEYQYSVMPIGGTAAIIRAYNTTATATWTPATTGTYTLIVSARETTLPATVVTKTQTFTVAPALSAVAVTTALASPRPVATAIKLTGVKTGGANVQYQFSTSSNGGSTWTVAQAYGAAADYTWTPSTPGSYQLKVAAREGSGGTPVESTATAYTVTPAPPTAVALAASPTAMQVVNTAVALTATKTGGSTVEYQFTATPTGGTATIIRAYNTTATATWTPATAGTYTLAVTARETTLPATVVTKTQTFTITPVLSAVAYTTSLASPQPVGKTIKIIATKTGGANAQYQFSASSNDGSTWSVVQAWSTAATLDWMPATAGTWQLKVAAREGSNGTPVETAGTPYTIAPAPPTAVVLAASLVSPQVVQTAVQLTATKTGGNTVEYQFIATPAGGTSAVLRTWASGATIAWTPASAGTYTLAVSARESTLPATVVTKTLSYTVTPPLTAVSCTFALASPQPVRKAIKLTATKTGGANVQYQFTTSSNGGSTWTVLQAYSTAATCNWMPDTPGSYLVKAVAREGASGEPVESTVSGYTITPAPPTALSLTATPVSPQPTNTVIALLAGSTGGTNAEYQLEVSANNGATWTVARAFNASTAITWTPNTAGAYKLKLSGREATLPAVVTSTTVAYTVTPPLTAVTLTTSLVSPQTVNKSIKLTAVKTGGASVQYQFSLSTNGGSTWSVLQAFGTGNTRYWVPTQPGAYRLKVAAREGATGTPVESVVATYTINGSMALAPGAGWVFQLIAHGGAGNQVVSIGETAAGPGELVAAVAEVDEENDLALFLEQPGQPPLAADLRAGMAPRQWHLVVRRETARDTLLTWPDLRAVPRGVTLTLVDEATGGRCAMRSSRHYVIPATRTAGEHRLRIEATNEIAMPLRVLGLRPETTRGAGARVVFTLTGEARVTLTVRGATGRVVRRIITPQPLAVGEHALVWDGRSDHHSAVPPGLYQLELLATDNEGRTIRALTMMTAQ